MLHGQDPLALQHPRRTRFPGGFSPEPPLSLYRESQTLANGYPPCLFRLQPLPVLQRADPFFCPSQVEIQTNETLDWLRFNPLNACWLIDWLFVPWSGTKGASVGTTVSVVANANSSGRCPGWPGSGLNLSGTTYSHGILRSPHIHVAEWTGAPGCAAA